VNRVAALGRKLFDDARLLESIEVNGQITAAKPPLPHRPHRLIAIAQLCHQGCPAGLAKLGIIPIHRLMTVRI
jgi:hypothetical protein